MDTFQFVCMCITFAGLVVALAFILTAHWYTIEASRIRSGQPSRRTPRWVRIICRIGRI